MEASRLRDEELGALLRREGIHETVLAEWKATVLEALGPQKKANADSRRVRELEKQPGGPAAAAVFRAQSGAWAHRLVDAAYAGTDPAGIHRSITDQTLRLTVPEARELAAEVNDVLQQWADRTRGRAPERRTYSFLSIIQPLPESTPE